MGSLEQSHRLPWIRTGSASRAPPAELRGSFSSRSEKKRPGQSSRPITTKRTFFTSFTTNSQQIVIFGKITHSENVIFTCFSRPLALCIVYFMQNCPLLFLIFSIVLYRSLFSAQNKDFPGADSIGHFLASVSVLYHFHNRFTTKANGPPGPADRLLCQL